MWRESEMGANSITINICDGCRVEQYSGSRSMLNHKHPEKSITPGSKLIVLPVSGKTIRWGEIYVIYLSDGIVVRRLFPGDDEDHIKGVSNNEEEGFLPLQIPKSDIKGLAELIGVINVWKI